MSGGIAYVLNQDGGFKARCNLETLDLDPLDDQDHQELRLLIERHFAYTGSAVADRLLKDWSSRSSNSLK